MRKKGFYIYFLVTCTMVADCNTVRSSAATAKGFVPFNDAHLQYEGRMTLDGEATTFCWPGSSVKLRFNGTGIKAVLKDFNGQNYFNVIIDNNSPVRIKIDSTRQTYTLAQNLSKGEHTVTLFKLTQAHLEYKRGYTQFYGFEVEPGTQLLSPPPCSKRAIEFYGNSITCGHGILDSANLDRGAPWFEDNYIAYGSLTARHFNARYRCIAKSGIGLMVSYGSLIMPEMYDLTNPFDSTSKWNFAQYEPQIVVVNLMQNDQAIVTRTDHPQFTRRFGSMPPSPAFVISAYQKFIQQLRSHYPRAHIICAGGSMDLTRAGSAWTGYIEQAVKNINDTKIYTHFFKYKGSPKHPLVKDHEVMAESLIRFIEQHIKW